MRKKRRKQKGEIYPTPIKQDKKTKELITNTQKRVPGGGDACMREQNKGDMNFGQSKGAPMMPYMMMLWI